MIFDVRDFENKGRVAGEHIPIVSKRKADTQAIQAAIDAAAVTGGKVVTEAGRKYLIGTLFLKSNVELVLSDGSVLEASGNVEDYEPIRGESGEVATMETYQGRPVHAMIYALHANNIAVTGRGCIDGLSEAFVTERGRYHRTGSLYPRPTVIYFEDCKTVKVSGVVIRNAPFWTLHPAGCTDVRIEGIKIHNRLDMANSDGIDPDHCKNVVIRQCEIQCADDCICLKNTIANREYGICENVLVEDCKLVSTSAGIKIGTEGIDDFRNITVKNCRIKRSNRGISIQIRDSGSVCNVSFERIEIETRRFFDGWWGRSEPIAVTAIDRNENIRSGRIENIRFQDIQCVSENGILVYADQEKKITGLFFEDLKVKLQLVHKWKAGYYDLRPCAGEGLLKKDNSVFYNHEGGNIEIRNAVFMLPKEKVTGFRDFVEDDSDGIRMENVRCERTEK